MSSPAVRRIVLALSGALASVVAGCAEPPAPATGRESAGAPESTVAPASTPAGAANGGAHVALEGEGLRVFLEPSGSARPIPFGTPKDAVLRAVAPLLETGADSTRGRTVAENLECGATAATWRALGLTLWFTASPTPSRDLGAPRFVGWSVARVRDAAADSAGSTARPTTASGVGVGSTRAELESVYAANVTRTSLGIEFSAGRMAGTLSGSGDGAKIEHMWAGAVCLAR